MQSAKTALLILIVAITPLAISCGGSQYRARGASYGSHGAYCDLGHYRVHRNYHRGCKSCAHYSAYHSRGRRY